MLSKVKVELKSVNHNCDSRFFCTFVPTKRIKDMSYNYNISYSEYSRMSYEDFRMWFNANFSLSFNGKFRGLGCLGSHLDLFVHKLLKILVPNKHKRPLGDVIAFRVAKCNVKLYYR